MNTALPALPVVDIREGGPLHHARQSATTARALRDACLRFFPRAALPLVPDNSSPKLLPLSAGGHVKAVVF